MMKRRSAHGNGRGNGAGSKKVRYAVVGLGYIAQAAVLPAFAHAGRNSALAALVSDDPEKRDKLGRKYGVSRTYSYEDYEACLRTGDVDAVYIALPNNLHCEYTVAAAKHGIHVLCEKPMAVTEDECRIMIDAADGHHVKLMIAYRLHFEEANMKAVQMVKSGKIGYPKLFNSVFTMQVKDRDIRLQSDLGGGTLYDIGIYCINAARYLFQEEPIEVSAFTARSNDPRFKEVDEMTGALMRFPDERVAAFVTSFGAADVSAYDIVGTKGHLHVEPAYEYVGELQHRLTMGENQMVEKFPQRDQFAPELMYFSDCILNDRAPEPSGLEGLIDVRIIRALYESAEIRRPVPIEISKKDRRPSLTQEMKVPPVKKPRLVHAASPSS